MKKIISAFMLFAFLLQANAYALDFSVKNAEKGIIISGTADDLGDMVTVTVYDKDNNLVYVDQKKCRNDKEFTFNAAMDDTVGAKVKVGGEDYSPILEYAGEKSAHDIYYVYQNAENGGDGTYDKPFSSLGAAYDAAKDGDEISILGEILWDSGISGEKKLKICGGKIKFNQHESINFPAEFENTSFSANPGTVLNAWKITVGKNVKFSDKISINADYLSLSSGEYANISAKTVEIYANVEFDSITDSKAVIIEKGVNADETKMDNCSYIVWTTAGGICELSENGLLLAPADGRYVSVNGGAYSKTAKITETGTYNVTFDYDFKIHEVKINKNIGGYVATVDISAYNRNGDADKTAPGLAAGIYDENGTLISVVSKNIQTGSDDSVDLKIGKIENTNFNVRLFMWDSFAGMNPLCEIGIETKAENKNVYYVSPSGDDSGSGSIAKPFKSIKQAVAAASKSDKPSEILLREGVHKVDGTVSILSDNITVKPYREEKAVITTGYSIKGSQFSKVSDSVVANIIDDTARANVVSVDMSNVGISDLGRICDYYYNSAETVAPTVTQDNKRMELAAYPDGGYLHIADNAVGGADAAASFGVQENSSRMAKWGSVGIFADGYPEIQWKDSRFEVEMSGTENNFIFTQKNKSFDITPKTGERVRFINVPEEISVPGEWYLDRDTKKLYIYPYDSFNANSTITFTPRTESMETLFEIEGTQNVSFEGIKFEHIGAGVFNVKASSGMSLKKCTFTDILGDVLKSSESTEMLLRDNLLHNLSGSGFSVNGGDSRNLIKANNIITNNEIYDFSNDRRTYAPAINISGCGNTVSHNKIYDAPHMAIGIGGIYFTVEYNEIFDVCNDTADAGALYGGQFIHLVKNKIRYNYFHDIKNNTGIGYSVSAVYFDDLWSSCDVYSNIFANVERAGHIGGGRRNIFEKNIFINCNQSVIVEQRGNSNSNFEDFRAYVNLYYSPYQSELWKKEFPEVYNILNDEPLLPKYNKIVNNAMINTAMPSLHGEATKNLTEISGNLNYTSSDAEGIFNDYENGDFGIKADSEFLKNNPDFADIDFKRIGLMK